MFIENIRPENIRDCAEIYNRYVLESVFTLEEEVLTEDEYKKRVEGVKANNYPFIVAKDDGGKVIGFAYLDFFNPRVGYRHTEDLSIYVSADCRQQNVGGEMLAHIEKLALNMGITNIISIITSENEASCRFHEKHGFLLEGKLQNVAVKFGKILSVSYYRKPIGEE